MGEAKKRGTEAAKSLPAHLGSESEVELAFINDTAAKLKIR